MTDGISFEVLTPDGRKFQADVYSISLPTPDGLIGILPHHIPLISLVVSGVISIRHRANDQDDQQEHIATAGGFVEIDGQHVRLLADSAERADDIDELKAQEALARAQELKHEARDAVTLADAVGLIELHSARLKVAELKRRRRV